MTLAASFNINWPGDAMFGPGRVDTLGELLASRGQKRAMIVTDPGLEAAGVLGRVQAALDKSGVAHKAYTGVEPNPTTRGVAEANELWKSQPFDALIALGGGSAMDTGKGLMAEIITGATAEEAYDLDIDKGAGPTPPFYALPTTSGTGSESSLGAVLKSPSRKFVIRGRRLQPPTVIMDPELTLSLPPRMTAMTGFDAYCHALGAFTNNQVNPVSDELALQSMRLLIEWLPVAVKDGANIEARAAVMQASWLAGVCLGQVGVDGIHGLATPIESKINAVHGEVLGVILPHMVAFNAKTQGDRYALAARWLGLATDATSDAEAATALTRVSLELRAVTGGREKFSEIGIDASMIPDLVRMALLSQATHRNGRPLEAENIASLYEAMI